jgi:hypothetical protein
VRWSAGSAEFGGIRDPAELSTTDPPNRRDLPVWHWCVEPLDIDDAFRGGSGIGDEYYLIADFEGLLWHALRRFEGTVVAYSWAANRR